MGRGFMKVSFVLGTIENKATEFVFLWLEERVPRTKKSINVVFTLHSGLSWFGFGGDVTPDSDLRQPGTEGFMSFTVRNASEASRARLGCLLGN